MLKPRRSGLVAQHRAQRGISIVELMVGLTVGLIVLAGAMALFVNNTVNSRHMLVEARLNQDLRAVADLITRDVRRAGYWGNAIEGTKAVGVTTAAASNPYAGITMAADRIEYAYSKPTLNAGVWEESENNALDYGTEAFGFRLHQSAVQMKTQGSVGGGSDVWTNLTNPDAVKIDQFTLTPSVVTLPLGNLCVTPCSAGTPNCPTVNVRSFTLVLRGYSASDNSVVRRLQTTVRVRGEEMQGYCS
jgi:type IV pilus assembly protein PilW